jgi:16S rRNA (guanine527-N7)-methyltransferase
MDSGPNGPQRVAERISPGDSAILQRFAALLRNSPHNLVAANDHSAIYDLHVLESWAVADAMLCAGRWLDLGTGGGLPGLVAAVRHRDVEWVLVDATRKKLAAVDSFVAVLGLDNVRTVHGRAEELAHGSLRGACDGVLARAVAPLPTLIELARGFLAPGGCLAAVKGPAWRSELSDASSGLRELGFESVSTAAVPDTVRPTWLVTMRVAGLPPAGYPRRNGLPQRAPLGRPPLPP